MDKEYAPMFVWSPDISKEYKHFKLTSKCPECGVFHWTLKLVKSDGTPVPMKLRLERDTYIECRKCQRRFPICNTSNNHPQNLTEVPTVKVHRSTEKKRVQVANEVINVPQGVTITVKRSRVIEHSIDINWQFSSGIEIELGLQPIIKTVVRGEIEKAQGRKYQESETIEYEIELSGETSNRYSLTWTDIWLTGKTEIQQSNTTRILPFQFREYSELEVAPASFCRHCGFKLEALNAFCPSCGKKVPV
ncbi:zinc ribbon domain-containing protein [Brasilonema bromeliae]|nr:zinc ribbon domain-containing protein [Brasilonema bromeliae]